ncbi:alpha/beta hydrolase family protein [Leeuwenhoekiella aestuarii]|uniref:Dipeptidyl aminopeptidase/acylaminoacyl peptidase n=1 Tax=Leeuwenhoekiella aestuarii TaxID=2249426 RepID=A0A4Q0NR20_9FLAO|nr:prolyl oligopeptidase family serine peptidase [Leeuwenhoekiella aestuarii]RXG13123.1 dipeptidyl aminopeptidase/acylaminoacyl peptidase [Leeuwenhoekiella aestuarii]
MNYLINLVFSLGIFLTIQAQENKADLLSEAYYTKWTTIHTPQLSEDGRWVAAATRTKTREFHLYLFNTETGDQLQFPGGKAYSFIKNTPWFTYTVANIRYFLNLEDLSQLALKDLKDYLFLEDGEYLFTQSSNDSGQLIRTKDQQVLWDRIGVREFKEVSEGKEVLIWLRVATDQLIKLKPKNQQELLLHQTPSGSIKKVTVDENAFAWIEEGKSYHKLYVQWKLTDSRTLNEFDLESEGFPPGSSFKTDYPGELILHSGKKALIFDVQYPRTETPYDTIYREGVEQWNGSDLLLYPLRQGIIYNYNSPRRIVWWTQESSFMQVTSKEFPKAAIHPSLNYALVYNINQNPKMTTLQGCHDIWLVDLNTEERKLLLANFPYAVGTNIKFGPNGNILTYYKNQNWWLYDLSTGEHSNITGDWDYRPINEFSDDAGLPPPASEPVWSKDGKYLFLSDFYDLNAFNLIEKSWRAITDGRPTRLQYRFTEQAVTTNPTEKLSDPYTSTMLNLDSGAVLEITDLKIYDTGFILMNPNFSVAPLVMEAARLDFLKYDKQKQHYIYRSQSYDQPESLWIVSKGNKPRKLLQTNAELLDTYKPKAELVHYKGMKNESLKGILYYPLNYQPDQKYPIVTHIYQRVSLEFHNYYKPGYLIEQGILNPFVLQQEGYFVFYPDINYVPGNIKESAYTCIMNGLEALDNTSIDRDRMALEGFSFGGYQSGLIATKLNPFKTIVAGAPPIDPMRGYFNINDNLQVANYFFYETHQLRQQGIFFDYKEAYFEDSVLAHSDAITTPMLLYTGGEDGQVDWKEGLSLYLSLRRQQKPVIFLKYSGENHNLMKPENNEDLSKRMLDWFDYHLKGKRNIPWIDLEFKSKGAP